MQRDAGTEGLYLWVALSEPRNFNQSIRSMGSKSLSPHCEWHCRWRASNAGQGSLARDTNPETPEPMDPGHQSWSLILGRQTVRRGIGGWLPPQNGQP